jgi:hypothetical protein
MKCTNCGAELPPDADFCTECGAPRPEAQPPPLLAAPQPQDAPSSKGARGKWALVGCIGVLAVVLLLAVLAGCWLLGLLFQSQQLPINLPGGEPTATPRPTPTWLPAPPPTPTQPRGAPTVVPPRALPPAVVLPYCSALDQSPVHVQEDQPVTVYWGWLATTEGYVEDFLKTATIEVTLDGEQVEPDTQSDIQYDIEDEGYTVGWLAEVGTLTPGTHRLEYHVTWSKQISDGWSTFGPGGEKEEEQEYCEIIVE